MRVDGLCEEVRGQREGADRIEHCIIERRRVGLLSSWKEQAVSATDWQVSTSTLQRVDQYTSWIEVLAGLPVIYNKEGYLFHGGSFCGVDFLGLEIADVHDDDDDGPR